MNKNENGVIKCKWRRGKKERNLNIIYVHVYSKFKEQTSYLQLAQTVATNFYFCFTLYDFVYFSCKTMKLELWLYCVYLKLTLGLINLIKTTARHPGDMAVYQLDRPDLLITVYYIFIIIVANPGTHGIHWWRYEWKKGKLELSRTLMFIQTQTNNTIDICN